MCLINASKHGLKEVDPLCEAKLVTEQVVGLLAEGFELEPDHVNLRGDRQEDEGHAEDDQEVDEDRDPNGTGSCATIDQLQSAMKDTIDVVVNGVSEIVAPIARVDLWRFTEDHLARIARRNDDGTG